MNRATLPQTASAAESNTELNRTQRAAITDLARDVFRIEAEAVQQLGERVDEHFLRACEMLLNCRGRVVVCGVGKSGHIGSKIAATLASTGTPAFFLHAAEASHGDLGMLRAEDVIIAISHSGASGEILALLPGIQRLGCRLLSLCGNADSALAHAADVHLNTAVEREACPLNLAPTASTTAALAMGDALAVSLLGVRGFSEADFARSHPGGRLGRRLLLRVRDIMAEGQAVPMANAQRPLLSALLEISEKGLGLVLVVDDDQQLLGVFTDGDLRRTLDTLAPGTDLGSLALGTIMTIGGHSIEAEALAFDAVSMMQEHRISALPVLSAHRVIGVITMHQCLAAGVV